MALVDIQGIGDARLHFRAPLLGSGTETRLRLALERPNTTAGTKRRCDDGLTRLLACFDSDDGPLVCHILHRQVGRISDNVNEWRAAAAAASAHAGSRVNGCVRVADVRTTLPPFLALQFGPLLLRLTHDSDVPDARGAELLGATRDAMLRELPRAAAPPAAAPAEAPDRPEAATSVGMRVAHWQAFVRCAHHLLGSPYSRARLAQAMTTSLAEATAGSGTAALSSQRAAEAAVREREGEYVQLAVKALRVATEAGALLLALGDRERQRRGFSKMLSR